MNSESKHFTRLAGDFSQFQLKKRAAYRGYKQLKKTQLYVSKFNNAEGCLCLQLALFIKLRGSRERCF